MFTLQGCSLVLLSQSYCQPRQIIGPGNKAALRSTACTLVLHTVQSDITAAESLHVIQPLTVVITRQKLGRSAIYVKKLSLNNILCNASRGFFRSSASVLTCCHLCVTLSPRGQAPRPCGILHPGPYLVLQEA